MAVVYLAHDLKHGRKVALKVLAPEISALVGAARFRQEIEFAARLQHPHILAVHDSGEAAGSLWFTMPYVEGESLRDRLRSVGRLDLAEVTRLAGEIASALDYAHRQGVIHRDIKPENILLSDGQALVADFGVARATSRADEPGLTATGLSLGTPAYMSPEQALGDQAIDGRSDIYSLGCLVFELLAGAPPYTGPSAQAIVAKHLGSPVPKLRAVRPEVPTAIEAAVATAMAKEASERFSTATAFSDALASPSIHPGHVLRPRLLAGALLVCVAGALGLWWRRPEGQASTAAPTVLAVLPFDNQGAAADASFADGLADEVRGKLSEVPGLALIARGSTSSYKGSTKPPRQIADELGVRYLLTGTVRWDRGSGAVRVRVHPELVEIPKRGQPTTRWQAPFEASLTDVFRVQGEIASKVSEALGIQLGSATRAQLARPPTGSSEAYEAYLQVLGDGVGDLASQNSNELRRSIVALEKAVRLDPAFAAAWAQLGRARLYLARARFPTDAELTDSARVASDRAVALDSTLAAAQLAAALVYSDLQDTARSAQALRTGLNFAPHDAELLSTKAVLQLDPARPGQGIADLERARALDPRSFRIASHLYGALSSAQRFPEAVPAADRLAALAPRSVDAQLRRVIARLNAGDSAGAVAVVREPAPKLDRQRFFLAVMRDFPWLYSSAERREAFGLADSLFETPLERFLVLAREARVLGDTARGAVLADSALLVLRELQGTTGPRPDGLILKALDAYAQWLADNASAALASAVAFGQGVLQLPDAQYHLWGVGITFLEVGQPDSALAYLRRAISGRMVPDHIVAILRFDPRMAYLRAHPDFKPLLARLVQGSE
jgi:eukaryotic-like serine/threonine-protein kinase